METIAQYVPSIETLTSSIAPIKKNISKYVEFPSINPQYQSYIYQGPSLGEIAVSTFYSLVDSISYIFSHTHPNYLFVAAIFAFAAIFVYIKLKYPFWSLQPVLHTYDIGYRLFSKPHIYSVIPSKTKYYDTNAIIKTDRLENISREILKQICELLQSNYMKCDNLFSTITEKDLVATLSGHNNPVFLSIMPLLDKPIGIMVSRPLHFYLAKFDPLIERVYYFDYMCMMKTHESRIHTLFQTHEYNQRIKEPGISIGLFKKEIQLLEAVIPLVEYTSYSYYLRNTNIPALPAHYHSILIGKNNTDILSTLFNTAYLKSKFGSFVLYPDLPSILGQIRSGILYVGCIEYKQTIYGYYILKNAHTAYDNIDGLVISLVASYSNTDNDALFYAGYLNVLKQVMKEHPEFKIINIEALADNLVLLPHWNQQYTAITDAKCAYYLYNAIYPNSPLSPKDCFIV